MNIYLIHQEKNNGYDTYDSAVVIAQNENDAKLIHPMGKKPEGFNEDDWEWLWTKPEFVEVRLIGIANEDQEEGAVICSSFNAG